MYVNVYSRSQVIQVEPDPTVCLITISTPSVGSPLFDPKYNQQYNQQVPTEGWFDVLTLQFHDLTHQYDEYITLFDDQMAQDTVKFIERNKNRDFIVHCDAGKSRSVAIGRFINQMYGHQIKLHAADTDRYHNVLVTRQLHKVHGQLTK